MPERPCVARRQKLLAKKTTPCSDSLCWWRGFAFPFDEEVVVGSTHADRGCELRVVTAVCASPRKIARRVGSVAVDVKESSKARSAPCSPVSPAAPSQAV